MSVKPEYIGIDDSFTFSCNNKLSCFNMCCNDVNQFLYPYDILRLKNSLGISSTEFLDTYCMIYSGDTTGLPVASFNTSPANGHACPFVSELGCTVYSDRPASCRIFPLARAISRSRENGEITEHFALIKDPDCQGFADGMNITAREWIQDQDLETYNIHNDKMIRLVSLKQQVMPGPLDNTRKDMFVMACYDIDRFRSEILNNGLIKESEIGKDAYGTIKTDDVALLDTGLDWIRHQLFGKG